MEEFGRIVKRYPQSTYVELTKSLQQEWLYVQRVVPRVREKFAPIEKAIVEDFLLALLGQPMEVATQLRGQLAKPARMAGLGISNPVEKTEARHAHNRRLTAPHIASLKEPCGFDTIAYAKSVKTFRMMPRLIPNDEDEQDWQTQVKMAPAEGEWKRIERAAHLRRWLTAMPSAKNRMALTSLRFQERLNL